MSRKLRLSLMAFSEKNHPYFHVLFGIFAFAVGYYIEPEFFSNNLRALIIITTLGSFLPDIDHIFYIFIYGRRTNYSKTCKELIRKFEISALLKHIKANHKYLTGIYSHNLGTVFLTTFFTFYELNRRENVFMFMFFLAWTFHYIYDFLEDLLFFKKPNKNWFFIFNKK